MNEEIKKIPSKIPLEQLDVSAFAKDKIRDLYKSGKLPTAEALVDEIILRALKEGATDIHFEPGDTDLRIRLGKEGILKKLVTLPREIMDNLGSTIKTRSGLNAFEKKKVQEGRFTVTYGTMQFDVRISTVPALTGERIALRILYKMLQISSIQELGFSEQNLERFKRLLKNSSGLLLVTGPSGSGKTTTVYAAVNELQAPTKNIYTVENPVEYKLDFATQVQTPGDKSFSFADALRAILRQNPHLIMLGEIRDAETGTVAAEAAVTGNLVLSTMLSTDAIGTIPRLLNLGIPPFWLATTLIGVVYQQLVRKICDSCKEPYTPTQEELALLGDGASGQTYYHGKGCDVCGGTGYAGRVSVHEILSVNDEVRDVIYSGGSFIQLKDAANKSGFENIRSDAIKKVCAGLTTLEQCQHLW